MEKKILLSIIGILSVLGVSIFYQNAYAQSSATFGVFQTSNASDDTCTAIAQTGSVVWLGCFSSTATTTLRINAMNGNTTLATTTLASQNSATAKFVPIDNSSIALVDISGASEVVRKYTLSGSTITNTASVTLTNCGGGGYRPSVVSTSLFFMCTSGAEAGNIKVINLNTMVLTNTYSTLIQGNCASPQSLAMVSDTRGVVFCDNTEAYLFQSLGGTITLTDDLTGWTSLASNRWVKYTGQTGNVFTIWTGSLTGNVIQVATVDFSPNTWSSGITTVPSQADAVEALAVGIYMFTIDDTDENVLIYDWREEQPSVALANLSDASFIVSSTSGFSSGSDNESLLVASSITDTGRYYVISSIVIDGVDCCEEGGGFPDPGSTGGVDCSLPENFNILICRITTSTGGGPSTLPRVGILIFTQTENLLCSVLPIADADCSSAVGWLYTLVAFGVFGSMLFVASKGQLLQIPSFIWIIGSIGILALAGLFQWIDATAIIIGVLVIIALASSKILSFIGGGGFR